MTDEYFKPFFEQLNPAVPEYMEPIKGLSFLKDLKKHMGFSGMYKSLVHDPTQISRLGSVHEAITRDVRLSKHSSRITLRQETGPGKDVVWKTPL